jgi:hypothetical protein
MNIYVPISIGELYDKISILEIKIENINDGEKISNVKKELELLNKIKELHPISDELYEKIKEINLEIWDVLNIQWDIEYDLKNKQSLEENLHIVELSRKIYILNDKRAKVKKEINLLYDSNIIEEKFYKNC